MNHSQKRTSTRYALLVAYEGSRYSGSQYQRQHGQVIPTIQQALQHAFQSLGLQISAVSFASRTDAGVHAEGQVGHVDIESKGLLNVPYLRNALNAKLPQDICVREVACDVGFHFHSRREAQLKWYRYAIINTLYPPVLSPPNVLWVPVNPNPDKHNVLDVAAMHRLAQQFIGRHDFAHFQARNASTDQTVCDIKMASVTLEKGSIYLNLVATRFLYKMVRRLMGFLLIAGKPKSYQTPDFFDAMVQQLLLPDTDCSPWPPIPTAPPDGLTLMAVAYPPPHAYFQCAPWLQALR